MRADRFATVFRSAALVAALLLSGCGDAVRRPGDFTDPADLNRPDCRVGYVRGGMAEETAVLAFPDAKTVGFDEIDVALAALASGRLEGFVHSEFALHAAMRANRGRFAILDAAVARGASVIAVTPARADLVRELNAFIGALRRSGISDEMTLRWCRGEGKVPMPGVPAPKKPVGTMRVGTSGLNEPFSFADADGELAGYDVEFAKRFAACMGCTIELVCAPPEALASSLSSGSLDLVVDSLAAEAVPRGCLASESYFDCDIRLLVRDVADGPDAESFDGLLGDLHSTTAAKTRHDQRWRLIARGLVTTLALTFLAGALGFMLSFGICALRMARRRFWRGVAAVYIAALQGTPVLIVLLILFYSVFAPFNIATFWISVVALGLSFSANAAEALRVGVRAVPASQREGALALGATSRTVFLTVVLPQALRTTLPVLRSAFVTMMQQTSIVGYIAVLDLTMAVDLISGHTYRSLAPLLLTAFVYFTLAWLMSRAFDFVGRRLDPRSRRRERRLQIMSTR